MLFWKLKCFLCDPTNGYIHSNILFEHALNFEMISKNDSQSSLTVAAAIAKSLAYTLEAVNLPHTQNFIFHRVALYQYS